MHQLLVASSICQSLLEIISRVHYVSFEGTRRVTTSISSSVAFAGGAKGARLIVVVLSSLLILQKER